MSRLALSSIARRRTNCPVHRRRGPGVRMRPGRRCHLYVPVLVLGLGECFLDRARFLADLLRMRLDLLGHLLLLALACDEADGEDDDKTENQARMDDRSSHTSPLRKLTPEKKPSTSSDGLIFTSSASSCIDVAGGYACFGRLRPRKNHLRLTRSGFLHRSQEIEQRETDCWGRILD